MYDAEFELRPAAADDLAELLPLVGAYHAFEQVEMSDQERAEAVAPLLRPGAAEGRVWLVRVGDETVGYIALTFGYSIEFGGRDAFIDEFFLAPEHRGRGLGTEVLKRVRDEARARGIRALHLEVARDNAGARRLYERWGFHARTRYHLMSAELPPGPGPDP